MKYEYSKCMLPVGYIKAFIPKMLLLFQVFHGDERL